MAIHLFNPLWDASGGSEWRTISLFQQLADHADVEVWTEYTPDPALMGKVPLREMLKLQTFPKTGTFVFIGAYWEIGAWMKYASPDRVILTYNVADPEGLEHRIAQLHSYGVGEVELVFPSEMFAQFANGRKGTVEYSPIDFEEFAPAISRTSIPLPLAPSGIDIRQEEGGVSPTPNPLPHLRTKVRDGALVIGRHSRDQSFKHHPGDPGLYRDLIGLGWNIRILGGTCLELEAEGIELLPANSEPAPEFLRGLDVFFYRTDPSWVEAYGRVVAEAMGCALPCVVEDRGGYVSLIEHGVNGFLFSTEEEAMEILALLQSDDALRARVGAAARESIVTLYEGEKRKMIDFYLREKGAE